MLDIYLAARIARTYGNRASERGGSKARAGVTVFLTIIGTEIAVAVWVAAPTFSQGAALGGAALGWLIGAGISVGVGALFTRGPILKAPEEQVEGRECFECQTPIVAEEDGVACGGCKHALHHRCLSEHALAHRAFEHAGGRPAQVGVRVERRPLADPPRGVGPSASGPSSSASLAGVECAQCHGEIVMRHQGTRCATCGDPVHGACAAAHRSKHFGPFRRAGGAS